MLQAFIEVLVDLWNFVFAKNYSSTYLLQNGHQASEKFELDKPKFLLNPAMEIEANLAYVITENTNCFSSPLLSSDAKIATFDYGDRVLVELFTDSYAKIRMGKISGFVSIKDLVDDIKLVLPDLKSSFTYKANNSEVLKLRKYIKKEKISIDTNLPLQPLEFILYKLTSKEMVINWPENASRGLGMWHHELRGVKGVSMSVEPRTSTVIEFNQDNGNSFAAWVDSVSPDLNITMQSVGRIDVGEYRSEVFTHDEWKEWRPVFISFS